MESSVGREAKAPVSGPLRDSYGRYNGKEVVGEFHTHPNPPVDEGGQRWAQGGHQGDWDGIAAEKYPGDSYIISRDHVWCVGADGQPQRDENSNEVPIGTREAIIGS